MISSGSMSHMDPIERAIALAIRASDAHEFPVGAVVHRDGIIIGEGMNQKETLKDPSAHAELLAVRAAAAAIGDWRLTGATLVSTLEPCPMCLGASIKLALLMWCIWPRIFVGGRVVQLWTLVTIVR